MTGYHYESYFFVSEVEMEHFQAYTCDVSMAFEHECYYLHRSNPLSHNVYERITPAFFQEDGASAIKALYQQSKVFLTKEQRELCDHHVIGINLDWFGSEVTLLDLCMFIDEQKKFAEKPKRVHVLGLGDVGGILSIGLKLLANEKVSHIGLYDINPSQGLRYAIELSQVAVNEHVDIEAIDYEDLMHCDVFLFCASKGVPPIGQEKKDVRMAQFDANAALIEHYARLAVEKQFKGLFVVVSDPVDLLCQVVLRETIGRLRPEQIRGYGLGVMHARAQYQSKHLGIDYENGRAFGPHGADLFVANSIDAYDSDSSSALTKAVVESNLDIRALGFKPFIAPAISSGAHAVMCLLKGEWHESAQNLKGTFWGSRNRFRNGYCEFESLDVCDALCEKLIQTYSHLRETWACRS